MLYEKTSKYIYFKTGERIRKKMNSLKFEDIYQLMGYESQKDYDKKGGNFNESVILLITNGTARYKENRYLFTSEYHELLKEKLRFATYHDMFWGNEDEFKEYSEELFYCLIEDMKEDKELQSNIFSLLEMKEKEEIYEEVRSLFIDNFWQFTLGNLSDLNKIDIVSTEKKFGNTRQEELVHTLEETLSFNKLNKNLEIYASRELRKMLIVSVLIPELSKD